MKTSGWAFVAVVAVALILLGAVVLTSFQSPSGGSSSQTITQTIGSSTYTFTLPPTTSQTQQTSSQSLQTTSTSQTFPTSTTTQQAQSSMQASCSPNPIAPGSVADCIALVYTNGGTTPPSGTVTFSTTLGQFNSATCQVGNVGNNQMGCSVEFMSQSPGQATIGVQYAGDSNYYGSIYGPFNVVVSQTSSTTSTSSTSTTSSFTGFQQTSFTVSCTPNPIQTGQYGACTALLSGNGVPSGTIQFATGLGQLNPTSCSVVGPQSNNEYGCTVQFFSGSSGGQAVIEAGFAGTTTATYVQVQAAPTTSTTQSTQSQQTTTTASHGPLTVSATANPASAQVGQGVSIDITVNGGLGPYLTTVFFGDGTSGAPSSTGSSESITHAFATTGSFQVQIEVGDQLANVASTTVQVSVASGTCPGAVGTGQYCVILTLTSSFTGGAVSGAKMTITGVGTGTANSNGQINFALNSGTYTYAYAGGVTGYCEGAGSCTGSITVTGNMNVGISLLYAHCCSLIPFLPGSTDEQVGAIVGIIAVAAAAVVAIKRRK